MESSINIVYKNREELDVSPTFKILPKIDEAIENNFCDSGEVIDYIELSQEDFDTFKRELVLRQTYEDPYWTPEFFRPVFKELRQTMEGFFFKAIEKADELKYSGTLVRKAK